MASGTVPIDNWSDSEIRTKLAELGTPVGPVTETTRKILIKKLKRLIQLQSNNASSPSKQRRSLVRYSSGEESQGEGSDMPPPTSKVKNLRRKTVGPTEIMSMTNNYAGADSTRPGVPDRPTRGTRKSLATTSVQKEDSLDTDSDSDISLISRLRKTRKSEILRDRSSPKPRENFDDVKNEYMKTWNSMKKTTISHTINRVPEPPRPVQEEEEEEEVDTEEEDDGRKPVFQSDFLTRLSSGGKLATRYRSSVSPVLEKKSVESPYVSGYFSQRNSRTFDDTKFASKYDTRNVYSTKPVDSGGSYSSFLNQRYSTAHGSVPTKAKINSFFSKYKNGVKLFVLISGVMAALIAIYFLLVANFNTTIYLAAIDSDENKYPICGRDGVDPHLCVEDEFLKPAMDISKILIPRVLDLTTKAYCDTPSNGGSIEIPTISEDEALKYLASKKLSISAPQLEKSLRNFKILVLTNPHWEVEVVGKGLPDLKSVLFNGDFAARRVNLPTGCYLRLMAYKLLQFIIFIVVLVGSGFGILFGARLYKRRQENHKREVYNMINKILNLLSAHHDQNVLPQYLAVNNCRDELIPPSERDKKKQVWDDAVEFLEKNESRVRTEVHSIRGENVKVWRWLPAGGPPLSPNTSVESNPGPVLGRLL